MFISPARLAGRLLPVAVSVHLRTWMTGGTGGVEVPLSHKPGWSGVSLVGVLALYLAWGLGSHVNISLVEKSGTRGLSCCDPPATS